MEWLVERHLAPLHFDTNYYPVNLMDLVRYWRRFPSEDLAGIIDNAVMAVVDSSILEYWVESKRQHCLVVWVEALYQLCTLCNEPRYRQYLAEAVIHAENTGLGVAIGPGCQCGDCGKETAETLSFSSGSTTPGN